MIHSLPALEVITIDQSLTASILKNRSLNVQLPLTKEDLSLIQAMKNKLYELGGVGLAAPQVQRNKRIIAIHISADSASIREEAKPFPMHILLNPTYSSIEGSKIIYDYEGCYSVASTSGKVGRYQAISVQYQDESGQFITEIASGFYARVLQHEIDHLDGILITDRLTPDCIQGSREEMMHQRRSELSPEKRKRFDELMANAEPSAEKES